MKKWFALLLAALMLCAMTGCGDKSKPDDKDTPTTTTATTTATTTTTAAAPQADAPLMLVDGEVDPSVLCYHFVDENTVDPNEELVLKANVDLTNVQVLSLNPDTPIVGEVLFSQPLHYAGQHWCIHTYINDAVPNRGIACTDKNGKTYYYAITYSMKGDGSPSLSLTELDIEALSAERLVEIETFLNDIENNGFVACTFSCPEEVSLSRALYDGAGIGVGSWEWTDEEVQDYMSAAGWEEMYTSATRFARADIEALLQEKLGVSLSDLTKDVDMLYIEKYDAYYHAHSDTQYQLIEVENGYIGGDRCVVYYRTRQSESFPYEYRTVILWITEDGYRFASNM